MQKKEIKEGEPLRTEVMKKFDLANIFYETMYKKLRRVNLKACFKLLWMYFIFRPCKEILSFS